jgi:hypothetical protein
VRRLEAGEFGLEHLGVASLGLEILVIERVNSLVGSTFINSRRPRAQVLAIREKTIRRVTLVKASGLNAIGHGLADESCESVN